MRRLLIAGLVAAALALAAGAATFARYGSFDPCMWMATDLAQHRDEPPAVARARIRGRLLMDGMAAPSFGACMLRWWRFRADTGPPARP